MLGQRLRRWPSINPALDQCVVVAAVGDNAGKTDGERFLQGSLAGIILEMGGSGRQDAAGNNLTLKRGNISV